ncbi:pheST operon leader peptide PheM [Yersinia sp. HM-2024]|nr:pheST operon leader peptide PheM [Yersinia massiliensis]
MHVVTFRFFFYFSA